LGDRLRLALIHDPARTPWWLHNALGGLPPSIEVIPMPGSAREALQRAAKEGYELVHVVADGLVSLACEGILYHSQTTPPEIPPSELSALLRGSRVAVLSLTPWECSSPDTVEIGGHLVPSAYRAFACLGSSRLALPSVVAPLGPLESWRAEPFWHGFYAVLGETLRLDLAMARAQEGRPPAPVAVFPRHFHSRLFRRPSGGEAAPPVEPTRIEAELESSRDVVEQLRALGDALPPSAEAFLNRETARQSQLGAELEEWLNLREGE
jgi:hypothetical protein